MYYEHEIIRDIYENCVDYLQEVCNVQKYGSTDYKRLDDEMRKTFVKVISQDLSDCYDKMSMLILFWIIS